MKLLLPPLAAAMLLAAVLAGAEELDLHADGEPTDPEGALAVVEAYEIDLEEHGLTGSAPDGERELEAWLRALLDLLRSLGLISHGEGTGS